MIDTATGTIQIADGCAIPRDISIAELRALWESDPCRVLHTRGDSVYQWGSYRARFADPEGRVLILRGTFLDDRLYQQGLFYLLPGEEDPNSRTAAWTDENEQQRRLLHDSILRAWIGDPPYDYAWGRVRSVYDSRGGFSEIQVTYNPNPD